MGHLTRKHADLHSIRLGMVERHGELVIGDEEASKAVGKGHKEILPLISWQPDPSVCPRLRDSGARLELRGRDIHR